MFIPFTAEEINKFHSQCCPHIMKDVSGNSPIYRVRVLCDSVFDTRQVYLDAASFGTLDTDKNTLCILNFRLSEEVHKEKNSKFSHLFLHLGVKALIDWAKQRQWKRLTVYSYEQLIHEVFLDNGMCLIQNVQTATPQYRGLINFGGK